MINNNLIIQWYKSIDSIGKDKWNEIFPENILKSFDFFKAQSESEVKDVNFLFLVIEEENKVLAIAPCFTYRLSLDVMASTKIRKITKHIKKIFPKFLSIRILGVGSLASSCEHHIGIVSGLSTNVYKTISKIISDEIKIKAKQSKSKLVFVKEVPSGDLLTVKDILKSEFYFYNSLPASIVPLFPEILPYPTGLKRKQRYRYRNLKKHFSENYYCEKIIDFSEQVKQFEEYYHYTLAKSNNQFEIMNEAFFKNINNLFANNSFLILIRDKFDIVHSIGLVLEDKDALIPIYIGLNYENSKEELKQIHINSIYSVIEQAEELGKELVMLGQTGYYSKALSGAFVQNLHLGFYSYNALMQFCIRNLFDKLFKMPTIYSNTYRKEIELTVRQKIENKGIVSEN